MTMATVAPGAPALAAEWSGSWVVSGDWEMVLEPWRATRARFAPTDLGSDPDWCRAYAQIHPGALGWVRLERKGEALVLPLAIERQQLRCCLGDFCVHCFHPRMLRLLGDQKGMPESEDCFRALLRTLLEQRERWDALSFTLPTAGIAWQWLQHGGARALGLNAYQPSPPGPHDLLEFPASFADYTAKFTPKTRKNRERELRHLQQQGRVRLSCYRRPEEVEPFLQVAGALSRRSYQHRLLRAGLRSPERLRPRLEVAARQGWLRSYVLWCNNTACSFLLGYQYRGRYEYASIGYDPEWAKWSVGTVLQWLVLQDMFAHDCPEVFDFGSRGPQKQYFGNRQFEEGVLYLFRPGVYPTLARTCHQRTRRLTLATGAWLEQRHIKPKAQRLLRRLAGC
ncbi:MAG: GNAT family N-acetyltransferase [Terriglobales bacterium]